MTTRRFLLPVTFLLVVGLLGASFSLSPASAAAPGVVTNVVPVVSDGQVALTWTNPTSTDFTGTMVRYSSVAFPTSSSDGTLASDV
ncbi:MAG: hypothetical protein AAB663_01845, partial [Patescibacteria group bacterium]